MCQRTNRTRAAYTRRRSDGRLPAVRALVGPMPSLIWKCRCAVSRDSGFPLVPGKRYLPSIRETFDTVSQCPCSPLVVCALCRALSAGGCSPGTTVDNDDVLPESLALAHLFEGELARLIPARHVTNYEVNSPSFCDNADSDLVVKLPAGTSINDTLDGPFEFPVGTVLVQTLSYADADRDGARRIVETRV